MKLAIVPYEPTEADALAEWLSSDTWPYHVHPQIDRIQAQQWIISGMFTETAATFWIIRDNWEKIGLIRLYELHRPTILFDLRIWTPYRNQHIGRRSLHWLTDYAFLDLYDKVSVRGITREDNLPMRRVFRHCGYRKDGYQSETWPSEYGMFLGLVSYSMSKKLWEARQVNS